jgi:cysteine sulfinate desulfinase/cysteine desulfurase-like protein
MFSKFSLFSFDSPFCSICSEGLFSKFSSFFISTSAKVSSSVMTIYNDRKRASSTLRICLSHLTSFEDINKFLYSFDIIYKKLSELGE